MVIQVKYKDKMLSLYKMIKKFLLLKKFPTAILYLNSNIFAKVLLFNNFLSKVIKR